MTIWINEQALDWAPENRGNATVGDALSACAARPPYAVALNGVFVPRTRYGVQAIVDGDRLDVVQPVAGG